MNRLSPPFPGPSMYATPGEFVGSYLTGTVWLSLSIGLEKAIVPGAFSFGVPAAPRRFRSGTPGGKTILPGWLGAIKTPSAYFPRKCWMD